MSKMVTGEMVIKLDDPPPSVKPPMKIHVEHGENPGDLEGLKQKIQHLLREKLIFPSDITLVKPGTLPKFEYKAKLVEY